MATLEEVIIAWRSHNGGRIPINSEERKELLRDLLANLGDHDLLEDIKIKSNQNRIINACVNPGHNDAKKLAKWKAVVEVDLQVVLQEKFEEIKIRKATTEDFKFKSPENKEYVPPKPEPVKQPVATPFRPAQKHAEWMPTMVDDEDFLAKIGVTKDE